MPTRPDPIPLGRSVRSVVCLLVVALSVVIVAYWCGTISVAAFPRYFSAISALLTLTLLMNYRAYSRRITAGRNRP